MFLFLENSRENIFLTLKGFFLFEISIIPSGGTSGGATASQAWRFTLGQKYRNQGQEGTLVVLKNVQVGQKNNKKRKQKAVGKRLLQVTTARVKIKSS